jgi:hypothetical protein
MDWSAPVSQYCERTDASFWAEPLNAATNAAFLIAAAAAFLMWRRAGGRDRPTLALILVVVAVGLGSFTFHTVATRGAALADTIPIAIFIYGYLLLALRRFLALPPAGAVVIVVAYGAIAQTLPLMVSPGAFNGSAGYLPALVAMIAVALATSDAPRRGLALAAAIFTLSLTLRTIDRAACPEFPLGTHFVWHLLNAGVLYLLLHTAINATDNESSRTP